jgi:RNA polymerase sigma factor (sigma-70 family)
VLLPGFRKAAAWQERVRWRVSDGSAIERLPARDALLVRLVYLDGATYEEAAALLAVPVNSVSPWLVRAKERLRALLGETVYGEGPLAPPRSER